MLNELYTDNMNVLLTYITLQLIIYKGAEGIAQLVECVPHMHKDLGSIPTTTKKKIKIVL